MQTFAAFSNSPNAPAGTDPIHCYRSDCSIERVFVQLKPGVSNQDKQVVVNSIRSVLDSDLQFVFDTLQVRLVGQVMDLSKHSKADHASVAFFLPSSPGSSGCQHGKRFSSTVPQCHCCNRLCPLLLRDLGYRRGEHKGEREGNWR